jgi:ribosomal protein L11 methyltransferase
VCPGGVAVEAPFQTLEEGLAARIDTTKPAIVRGYLPALDPRAVDAAVDRVRRALGHLQAFELRPIGELHTRVVHEEDWAEAWKEHFPVLRVGRRLVIRPTWREHRPASSDVVIALDPGMAFGTGLHPTTRLCMAGIEAWADAGLLRGASVLDIGSGSGILALAAGLLGAGSVLAVDTDPLAVEATRRNAALNGLTQIIAARRGSVPLAEPRTFDIVVANLIAGLLVDLAPQLAAVLAPDGRLLASGIFHEREVDVRSAFERAGLRVAGRLDEDDWIALEVDH